MLGNKVRSRFEYRILASFFITLLVVLPIYGAPGVESSSTSDAEASVEADLESSVAAQGVGGSAGAAAASKLQVHGFLTQAFATANFVEGGVAASPTGDERALGIPEDGTFDYRTLALQFRYEISPKDTMIVQLSNRANGFSPINEIEDEIELDWAFYERRLGDDTTVKVGRVQIPFGIYNEIRDVGTILPFYRPAFVLYREGSFTSETVDGILLSHVFGAASTWSLSADVYAGEWEGFEGGPDPDLPIRKSRSEDALGIQLWLNTPLSWLRLGLSGQTKKLSEGQEGILRRVGEEQRLDDIMFSLDMNWERFLLRGEWRSFKPEIPGPGPNIDISLDLVSYYVQAGWYINDKIHLYLQREVASAETSAIFFANSPKLNSRQDDGIVLNYRYTPNIVLKAEYHDVEEEQLGLRPFGNTPLLEQFIVPADDGNYFILSFSASF